MISEKKISLLILLLIPILGFLYYFFWMGTVEISVENPGLTSFTEEMSNGKKVECKGVCRHRVRVGDNFSSTISVDGFFPAKIQSAPVQFLKTEKIVVTLQPIAEIKKITRAEFDQMQKEKVKNFPSSLEPFGPVLSDPEGTFFVFAEKESDNKVWIKTTDSSGNVSSLTVVLGEFDPADFDRLFTLSPSGITIPEKNSIYFYSFTTQRKNKIWDNGQNPITRISTGDRGEFVVQRMNGIWQKKFPQSPEVDLNLGVRAARFFGKTLATLQGDGVFFDDTEILRLNEKIEEDDTVWFSDDALVVERGDEVWRVVLPKK